MTCDPSKFVAEVHIFDLSDEYPEWTKVMVQPCDDAKFQRMYLWLSEHASSNWTFGFCEHGWLYKIKDPDAAFQFKMTFY